MGGARPLGRRGTGCLTSYPGRGHGPKSAGGGKLFHIRDHVIDAHLIKGLVNQVLVTGIKNLLDGARGHLTGGGRTDPGGGHGIVRLRRTWGSLVGHARFSKVRSKGLVHL